MSATRYSLGQLVKLTGGTFGPALRLLFHPDTARQMPRLLHEGVDPIVHWLIQANNAAIIKQWLTRGTKVIFISSFRRSGNTWMRYLLTDVMLQRQNIETTTHLPDDPDDSIPEFRCNLIARRITRRRYYNVQTLAEFVKTHATFPQLDRLSLIKARPESASTATSGLVRDCRVIYLYRAPEDALVSLYHFFTRNPALRARAAGGIDAFCRKEISGWIRNISGYLGAAENGFPIFFVSYERLVEKPALVLSDILRWVGVEHNSQMLQRAISNMQFGKLRAMEIQTNRTRTSANDHQFFFRRGQAGSGRVELQESTLREIHQQTASYVKRANERLMMQPSGNAEFPATLSSPCKTDAPIQNGQAGKNSKLVDPRILPCPK